MTVWYHCDGPDCLVAMTRNERRIAITVEEPEKPFDLNTLEEGELPLIDATITIYGDGDFHFCSDACLTSWAFTRSVEEA